MWNPFRGSSLAISFTQGAGLAVATLGCDGSPLRGAEIASTHVGPVASHSLTASSRWLWPFSNLKVRLSLEMWVQNRF